MNEDDQIRTWLEMQSDCDDCPFCTVCENDGTPATCEEVFTREARKDMTATREFMRGVK